MPTVLHYLALQELGLNKSHKFLKSKKVVLDILEYEAANPVHNQPCYFSGESRATFLVDFSPNMLRAASTHGDHTVRVTDIRKGKCTHILTGHPRTPWCLAFNPTSNDILASGCLGGEVRIWDLLGGGSEVLQNPTFGGVITSLAFHPSGQVLVFATANCIYFWDWTKPTPFAVTKTSYEYEKIRWLRFDPFGQYLFTGIANNSTIIPVRRDNVPSESRNNDSNRRRRYNRLMQRYQAFRQRFNSSSDYPSDINPRSPVHEENLNLARQYASHLTETTATHNDMPYFLPPSGSFLSDRDRESQRNLGVASDAFSAAHLDNQPESSLRFGGLNNPGGASTAAASGEADRNTRRRWGRYQPSFFASDNNNNDRLGFDNNNNDYNQQNPNLMSVPSNPLDQRSSLHMTSSSAFSPWVAESTSSAPGHGLESNEFEILPVDHDEGTGVSSATSSANTLNGDRPPNPESRHHELQSLLRRYRTTLLSSSTSQPSSSASYSSSSSFPGHQSVAGVNLTSSTLSSSQQVPPSVSVPLTELFTSSSTRSGTISSSASATVSGPSVTVINNSTSNLGRSAIVSGSSGIHSSTLDTMADSSIASRRQQPQLTVLISRSSQVPQHSSSSWRPYMTYMASSFGQIPASVTDRTSQTHGAMHLPERLDQSTDMTGLGEAHLLPNTHAGNGNGTESYTALPSCTSTTTFTTAASVNLNEGCERDRYRREMHEPVSSTMRQATSLPCTLGGQNDSGLPSSTREFTPFLSRALSLASTSSVNCVSMTTQSCLSNAISSVLGPSCFRTDSHLPISSSSTPSSNAALSLGPGANTTTSSVLNIPRGHLLRTKLSEVTVTTASGASSSRNCHLTSSSPVIHPAPSLASCSSSSQNVGTESSSTQPGRNRETIISATSASVLNPLSTNIPGSLPSQSHSTLVSDATAHNNGQSSRAHSETSETSTSAASDPVAEVQERLQQAVQQLREVQSRVQELTSSSTYSANLAHAACITGYLEQRVSDLDRRISDLEHRVESSRYLLSNNPVYLSRLGPNRLATSRSSRSARLQSSDHPPPTSAESGQVRPPANPRRRNQLLMSYLVNYGISRAPQSQRTLSFNPSFTSGQPSSSSSPSVSPPLQGPNSGAAASASLPLSITIQQADQDLREDNALDDDRGFRRRGGSGGQDSDWRSLQHVHLHPDYSSSILDDTINRPNERMQRIMNGTIARAFRSRDEEAVASNIELHTHRIQRWDISKCVVPAISNANENIVVEHCKLHNDATCDISRDGSTLATFVPSHRGFPDDNILGVFSLQKESFGQCLYTKSFGPNAISVSISPANHYVMVGLAAKRCFLFSTPNQSVGQVYKLVKKKAGEKSMAYVTDLYHRCNRGHQGHISVNSGRWLPGIGEGIVYGTNRGDLRFCRPGPRKVPESEVSSDSRGFHMPNLTGSGWRARSAVRSNMATQTTTVSIRRSSSTQTPGEESTDL